MEDVSEQQKLARIKLEGMKTICTSVGVDFKPVLNKVKELINTNAPKEEIFKEIDSLLALIAQMERFSGMDKEK
jgi:hypothetical protein